MSDETGHFQIDPVKFQTWIDELVPDPSDKPEGQPEGWVVLFGYVNDDESLSAAAVRKRYRLYLSLQLDEYLIIKAEDIGWAETLKAGLVSPMEGTLLWVLRGARIEYVRISPPYVEFFQQPGQSSSLQAQASFLRGPISGGYGLANLSAQQAGGGGGGATLGCGTGGMTLACGTGGMTLACGTGGVTLGCGTGGMTLACGTGGLTLGCPGGGASLGCPAGGVSLGGC